MKFNCGPTRGEKIVALESWHRWFAWYPIRIGSRDCRWLEVVDRKGTLNSSYDGCYWTWEHRVIEPDEVSAK